MVQQNKMESQKNSRKLLLIIIAGVVVAIVALIVKFVFFAPEAIGR